VGDDPPDRLLVTLGRGHLARRSDGTAADVSAWAPYLFAGAVLGDVVVELVTLLYATATRKRR
jgi:hypothetical protein